MDRVTENREPKNIFISKMEAAQNFKVQSLMGGETRLIAFARVTPSRARIHWFERENAPRLESLLNC